MMDDSLRRRPSNKSLILDPILTSALSHSANEATDHFNVRGQASIINMPSVLENENARMASSPSSNIAKSSDCVVPMSPSFVNSSDFQNWFGLGKINSQIWKSLSLCAYPILLETASGIDAQVFDVTLDGCERLCQVFDLTSDGRVSRTELVVGLESKGFSSLNCCNAFHELVDLVERLNCGQHTITPEQLSWILQRVKLEKLANSFDFDLKSYDHDCHCDKPGALHSFIYNARESSSFDIITQEDQREFFLVDEHHQKRVKSPGIHHVPTVFGTV